MNQAICYRYSSVQALLPESLSEEIIRWGEFRVVDDNIFFDPREPSYGREDEIHVTVLYGIHDERSDSSTKLLYYEPAFDIRLGNINIFSNNRFDVVKIDVHSETLCRLNERLSYNLPSTTLYPRYQPHITIAYVNKGSCDCLAGLSDFCGRVCKVDELFFYRRDKVKTMIPLRLANSDNAARSTLEPLSYVLR